MGRLLLLTRAVKATAGATLRKNPTSGARARRLYALAHVNPRRPTGPELSSRVQKRRSTGRSAADGQERR